MLFSFSPYARAALRSFCLFSLLMLAPRLTKAEIALSSAPHPHSSSSPRIATTSQSSWYGVFSASPCRNASISTRPDRGPGRPDIPEKQGSQGTSASPGRVTTTSSPFDMDADVSFVLVDRQACETPSLLEVHDDELPVRHGCRRVVRVGGPPGVRDAKPP